MFFFLQKYNNITSLITWLLGSRRKDIWREIRGGKVIDTNLCRFSWKYNLFTILHSHINKDLLIQISQTHITEKYLFLPLRYTEYVKKNVKIILMTCDDCSIFSHFVNKLLYQRSLMIAFSFQDTKFHSLFVYMAGR